MQHIEHSPDPTDPACLTRLTELIESLNELPTDEDVGCSCISRRAALLVVVHSSSIMLQHCIACCSTSQWLVSFEFEFG